MGRTAILPGGSDDTNPEDKMAPTTLVFSGHAREQMERRKITETDVEDALGCADTNYPGSNRENLVHVGTTEDGRRLHVVTNKRREHIVVTAYWGV